MHWNQLHCVVTEKILPFSSIDLFDTFINARAYANILTLILCKTHKHIHVVRPIHRQMKCHVRPRNENTDFFYYCFYFYHSFTFFVQIKREIVQTELNIRPRSFHEWCDSIFLGGCWHSWISFKSFINWHIK